ncbi:serine protease [Apophysomyces sp. BC1034]|nr:serine protease [Apophysomyces sp. BC1015]KAG0179311.1 serine protease [Apophysomyces sp. BC1021]KAG0189741.1 serine protease [Apophysomyces sp. BC1034]
MKLSIAASALLITGYALAVPLVHHQQSLEDHTKLAPLYVPGESIANSYIVVLKDHLSPKALKDHATWIQGFVQESDRSWLLEPLSGIQHVYDTPHVKGYAGKFDDAVIDLLRTSPDVAFIEKDSMVYANELQRDAPWGLARLSHRERLALDTYHDYQYNDKGGEGIKVYVIDTGINVAHVDFGNRATWGYTVPQGDVDEDGNGHGSHVAGTIAGKRYGVAKKAQPVAVKVLRSNGSGTMSDVIKGVDWATSKHLEDSKAAKAAGKKFKGSAANMSLGGMKSPSLDNFAVDAGIVFAVAAGNDNDDACVYSPAGAERAITVGASTVSDSRAYFSNYGPCVDVFAPGMGIESVWRGSNTATNTISGTSMASPHVAGLAAYFLSLQESETTPDEIKKMILSLATKGILTQIPEDTPNLLVFNDETIEDVPEQGFLKAIFGDI